jgi:hypothetical protein
MYAKRRRLSRGSWYGLTLMAVLVEDVKSARMAALARVGLGYDTKEGGS